jgi:hypothetical protein
MAKRDRRDIGTIGEGKFRNWCALEGLLCHKPDQDRMGWDFLVEFEEELDNTRPLDEQNEARKALVQIKSTDYGGTSTINATVSALQKLVAADLPAFIVLMKFDGGRSCREARLLHVGHEEIATILKWVRAVPERT